MVPRTSVEKVEHEEINKRGQQKLNFVLLLAPFLILASRKKALLGNVWKGNVIKMTIWPHYVLVHIVTKAHM